MNDGASRRVGCRGGQHRHDGSCGRGVDDCNRRSSVGAVTITVTGSPISRAATVSMCVTTRPFKSARGSSPRRAGKVGSAVPSSAGCAMRRRLSQFERAASRPVWPSRYARSVGPWSGATRLAEIDTAPGAAKLAALVRDGERRVECSERFSKVSTSLWMLFETTIGRDAVTVQRA